MNILIVAAHPDDESIGCGGTICLHTSVRGDRVVTVFLTSGELGLKELARDEASRVREREAEAAASVLGIAAFSFLRYPDCHVAAAVAEVGADLRRIVEREQPAMIYLPHPQDGHPDHQASLAVVQAALRGGTVTAPTLLTYEIWTPMADYYYVEDITPVLRQKVRAIHCHESQVRQLRYDRAARGLSQYRGAVAGACPYAEIFGCADTMPQPHRPGVPQ